VRRGPALALATVTAVYAAVTVTYALSVPVGGSADEVSHINYAQLISNHAALPGATVAERQQPPLYYLLSAALLRVQAPTVALRFLSIALGALAIVLVACTVWLLAPRRPWLAVGTAGTLALLPGFQFVSASVTDDSLATAVGALLLLTTTRVAVADALSRRLLLGVGCSIGVALISKETDFPLIVVLAGVVVWRWHDRLALGHVLPVALPVTAIAGWWYARNLLSFHRPLPPLTPLGVPANRLRTLAQLRVFLSQSMYGLFTPERYQGSPLLLPSAARALMAFLAAALLAGVAVGTVLAVRAWQGWPRPRQIAVVAYALGAAGALALSLANAVIVVFQPQGRYLLVAATGPLLALAWGVRRVARSRVSIWLASAAYIAGALSLSIIGLTTAVAASR
jgi:hypothetical protein